MKLALFSDVHGRLRIVLHLMRCWQMAHDELLDGALIAGDLGCFPDLSKIDKATKRWIQHDLEEAGFSLYFVQSDPWVEEMIREDPSDDDVSKINPSILFVAGNHEDYEYLNQVKSRPASAHAPEGTFPVDCYEAIHCLGDGNIVTLTGRGEETIRIAGLWGIGNTKPTRPYKISEGTINRLIAEGPGSFDLLLTHDGALGALPSGRGAPEIAEVLRVCQPSFNLFGHIHPEEGRNEFTVEGTDARCVILEDVGFGKSLRGTLEGCMAILNWDGKEGNVQLVDDDWLKQMRHSNWKHVFPKSIGLR